MSFASEQQSTDALAVIQGDKPAVIIELRKAPDTFEFYRTLMGQSRSSQPVDLSPSITAWWCEGDEGEEIVLSNDPTWYLAYRTLLATRHDYSRIEFQTAFGELLGYDAESIAEYVANPVDCECSKCGGPYAASYKQLPSGRYYDPNPRALRSNPAIQEWSNAYQPQADVVAEEEGIPGDFGHVDDPRDADNVGVYLSRTEWLAVRFALIDALYKENQDAGDADEYERLVTVIRDQVHG